jgi:8-oxo-dGTP diphosphatase
MTATVMATGRASGRTGWRGQCRVLMLRVWRVLPEPVQRLAVRLLMPRAIPGACAVIRDARGRVLLAHHTYRRDDWSLPGGFLRRGEMPAAGVVREVREELGVEAHTGRILFAEVDAAGVGMTVYYEVTIEGVPSVDGVELDGHRWVDAADLPAFLGREPSWLPAIGHVHRHAA